MPGNSPTPSAREAFAFFAKYRKQVDERERHEGAAREVGAVEQRTLLTQVTQHQNGASSTTSRDIGQAAQEVVAHQLFIPVDQTKGTPSFRLRKLRSSPTNSSPDMLKAPASLLPQPSLGDHRRITLVLDVDETLVHSSFSPKPGVRYDKELFINYDSKLYTVYVKYRPFLHDFLNFVSERFEVVIFTASLSAYCNPLLDEVDPKGRLGTLRLFREHCTMRNNSYIKDLFHLGRDLGRIAIIDNSPTAYLFQQRNAIPIKSWFDDESDKELVNLYTLLGKLANCDSVYDILDEFNANGVVR